MNTLKTHASELDDRTLVFAEGKGFLGYVKPLGAAFQVQDANGVPVALKSRESQAVAFFRYVEYR